MANDEPVIISLEDALAALPDRDPEDDCIHTFRQGGFAIIGADWNREEVVKALESADSIQVSGETAQAMHHGLAILDGRGPLFIETKTRTDKEAVDV